MGFIGTVRGNELRLPRPVHDSSPEPWPSAGATGRRCRTGTPVRPNRRARRPARRRDPYTAAPGSSRFHATVSRRRVGSPAPGLPPRPSDESQPTATCAPADCAPVAGPTALGPQAPAHARPGLAGRRPARTARHAVPGRGRRTYGPVRGAAVRLAAIDAGFLASPRASRPHSPTRRSPRSGTRAIRATRATRPGRCTMPTTRRPRAGSDRSNPASAPRAACTRPRPPCPGSRAASAVLRAPCGFKAPDRFRRGP